jgi:NHL repeat-containing protein
MSPIRQAEPTPATEVAGVGSHSRCAAAMALLALASCTLALLSFASAASADLSFGAKGSGAGQLENPMGVAVDHSNGTVYVADYENNRIDAFAANGAFIRAFGWGVADGTTAALQTCTTTCFKGIPGSGAGQLLHPRWIAVDNDPASPAYHDLYVTTAEDGNRRVQKFDPEGHFLLGFGWGVRNGDAEAQTCGPEASPPSGCQAGINGKGKCQLGGRDTAPLAVGPGGAVYVADSALVGLNEDQGYNGRIEKFTPSGACLDETTLFEAKYQYLDSIVVDSSENVYVNVLASKLPAGEYVIRKYPPASSVPLCEIDKGGDTIALALDSSDRLFAAQREKKAKPPGAFATIAEYDSGCNPLRRFAYGSNEHVAAGIAVFHSAAGEVFGSDLAADEIHYLPLPAPGPVLLTPSLEASPVGNTKATLYAELNPEGKETRYHYDYVTEATYLKDTDELGAGHGFDHAVRAPASPGEDPSAGSDFKLHAAEAPIGCKDPLKEAGEGKCLVPETAYRFRLFAKNADGEGNSPLEGKFKTRPPLEFGPAWSTDVGLDSAQLHTEVNPLGIPATGYFEYVDDATFQKDVEELGEGHGFDHATQAPNVSGGQAPLDLGSGETLMVNSTSLYPLSPGTTYHYRMVADNPVTEPTPGPERTFRTFAKAKPESCPSNEAFRTGPSALLPDCRAYEMVSPLDKNNGDVLVLNETFSRLPAALNQSAVSGQRLAYGTYRAFGDAKGAPFTSQYIAARDAGKEEWLSHAISPPRSRPIFGVLASADTEFKAFSPDLCQAWLRTVSEPPLAPGGLKGYPNIYRAQDEECGGPSYDALTTAQWQNFGPGGPGNEQTVRLELQGVSADGGKAIFIAPDSLVGTGAPNIAPDQPRLYIRAGGPRPVFACILPNGTALKAPCSGGMNSTLGTGKSRSASLRGAISADGTRVFWTASAGGPGKIYVREHAEQGRVGGECGEAAVACTIAVSIEGEELSGTSASQFLAAASDGSKALFAAVNEGKGVADLYEFDVDTETTTLIAHHSPLSLESSILGASEDLSRIYFASTDVMGGANSEGDVAQAGKTNLYLDTAGSLRFIGTLASADVANGSFNLSPLNREPRGHTARVSPSGEHAAFMSVAPLTGFDNTDAKNGEADAEVFLYNAAANEGQGELICASCNPTGGRPVGANLRDQSSPFWAAAQIPVFENTLYGTRVLPADGKRLFFESSDSLVARDTNGVRDVYEWEAPGSGGCDQKDATFSAQNEGCVDLVSSGQSAKGSEFLDASPSGNDVFFTTLSSLVPQDYGLVDVYDARVDGGFAAPPPPEAGCEGEACQGLPSPPNDPTPASAAFEGAGNVRESSAARCRKGKVRRKGRCVAKRHKRANRHQANHNRRAAQ